MPLDLKPPLPPMEAAVVTEIPEGKNWQYEPKWDGFRCLLFRDGTHVELQSKSGQPLQRYFPELVAAALSLSVQRFVLDGEIVIPQGEGFSFDALLQRIHPAASRVRKLAAQTPAVVIVFDLLSGSNGKSLLDRPLTERRKALEGFAKQYFQEQAVFRLSPATADVKEARAWLKHPGAMLDGVMAKRLDLPYASGKRDAMQKIKNYRSADCVVGGFRYGKDGRTVGSLLLGLYDDEGRLNHVGFTSAIASGERADLTKRLEKIAGGSGFTGNAPGGPSRWNGGKSAEWQPLRPKLVVEVMFDHASEGRFRHGTRLLRWRPDKAPHQCTMDQLRKPTKKGGTKRTPSLFEFGTTQRPR